MGILNNTYTINHWIILPFVSLSSFLGNQQNAAFCFVSLANLFCCFLSMALIMAPKILFIRKHAHDPREKEDDEKDTAELELKYREILRENENFQKKISEVSSSMYILFYTIRNPLLRLKCVWRTCVCIRRSIPSMRVTSIRVWGPFQYYFLWVHIKY